MSKTPADAHARRLFWLCWFAYSMSYIGRLNYSASMADILAAGEVTKAFLGSVGTGFLACYGAGQLLNGIIGDKLSPKFMVGIGLFGAGAANVLMGLNTTPGRMLIIWCANGYFQSMLWSPIIRCFAEWLPGNTRSKAGVNLSTTIPIGTILSYAVSSAVLALAGWRAVFVLSGALLIAASLVWFAGITSLRAFIARREGLCDVEDASAGTGQRGRMLAFPSLLIGSGLVFAVVSILFNGILKDGVTLWVPTFLAEYFGVVPSTAAAFSIVLPVVSLTGAYAAVWMNKKYFNNEMTTTAMLFGVSILSFVGLVTLGRFHIVFAAVLFALSLASMLGVNSMLLTFIPFHFSPLGKSASVTGFLNACSYFASAVSSVTIGIVAENRGWNITILTWIAVAVGGMAVGFAGKRFWAKGRSRLKSGWGYRS